MTITFLISESLGRYPLAPGYLSMPLPEIVDCGRSSLVDFPGNGFQYDIRPNNRGFLRPWCRLNQYKKRDIPYVIL